MGDIASTYFYLRELDLQLEIARRTVKLNDETVAFYVTRLQGGVSNRLEVDQAKANRAVTAATIPDIERQIAIAENALSVLLGRPPSAIARWKPIADDEGLPQVPSGLPAQLLERRPDVRQAEQVLVASNANIGVAKALFYPTISLTGSLGTVSSSLSDFMSGDSLVWSFGAGLFQPIFNGGRIRRNYEAAKARFDQALAQYQRSALNAYREVADALVTIQKLAERRVEIEAASRPCGMRSNCRARATIRACRTTWRCSSPTSSCSLRRSSSRRCEARSCGRSRSSTGRSAAAGRRNRRWRLRQTR